MTEKHIYKKGIKGLSTQTFYFSFLSPCTMCTQTLVALCKPWGYFGVSSMERILPSGEKNSGHVVGTKKNVPSLTSCVVLSTCLGGGGGAGDSTHTERSRSTQSSCLTFSTQKSHVSAAKGLKNGVQVWSKAHFEANWMNWNEWRSQSGHFICPATKAFSSTIPKASPDAWIHTVMIVNGWNITIPLTLPGQKEKIQRVKQKQSWKKNNKQKKNFVRGNTLAPLSGFPLTLKLHKLRLQIKSSDTLLCGLYVASVAFPQIFFFSDDRKVIMTTLRPIKGGAAGVVTFCLCGWRPFRGHSCRVSQYHQSVRLLSGSFSVFTFKRLVGHGMWKWRRYE